jgi:protein-S-isoprenylcysteine O-methyltransferase Ste14
VRKPSLPVYLALGVGFHGALYSALPRIASRRDRRLGWYDGRPGSINRSGLALVVAGAMFIAGAAAGHHAESPNDMRLSSRPDYLATGGTYRVSRNPLYVGGMTMWFGWAVYLGSRRAALAGAAWLAALAAIGVPYEERMLAAKFGDTYAVYQRKVRRWL